MRGVAKTCVVPDTRLMSAPYDPALPTTGRTGYSSYYDPDDDEFESVSQISGNKPVSVARGVADHFYFASSRGVTLECNFSSCLWLA